MKEPISIQTVKDSLTVEDKPEMPERIWLIRRLKRGNEYTVSTVSLPAHVEYLRADKVEREIDNYKMLLEEANRRIASLKQWDRLNKEMNAMLEEQLDASLKKWAKRERSE